MNACMHVCVCARMCARNVCNEYGIMSGMSWLHVYVHGWIDECWYVCIYVCKYALIECVSVDMYVHICVRVYACKDG